MPRALVRAYDNGKTEVMQEAEFLIDTGKVHWARITARLTTNPITGDLECILYGMDINDEVKYRNSMEVALRDYERLEDEAKRDVLTGVYSKKVFEQLTCSVGAVHCEAAEGRKLHDLMYEADKALYRAKAEGRDRYVIEDMT